MNWTQLPKGDFTGIDWAKPDATNGFDPYLVWAEADRFAGYGDRQPKWLPVAIELHPGIDIAHLIDAASSQWLHVPPVYTSSAAPVGLRYCTARIRPAFFKHIQPGGSLHGLINRMEMGLAAGPHAEGLGATSVADVKPPLKGTVMAIIDDGLAFANANFLRNGKARTRYFWRQDGKGVGHTPAGLGYGHELTATDINLGMQQHTYNGVVDEGAVYQHFRLSALQKSASHGTHVLDLACGPRTLLARVADLPPSFNEPASWALADDAASRCDIIAVQLDYNTVADTSGGSMNVSVMDGLMYILSRCAQDAKVVTNISFGTLAGPHDGSSLLEAAMDQLVELSNQRLKIVLAAGNSYQLRTHANLTLSKNEHATLKWRGQPNDLTENFLELWLPPQAHGIKIEITPPGRAALPALGFGQSGMWTDGGTHPLCALVNPKTVATGTSGTCALIAVAPTFSFNKSTTTAPSGVWQIKLTNTQQSLVTIDAYVERDDVVIGSRGGRQSHFEDNLYDMSGDPKSFTDHPNNRSLIRRSGNFNSIATGRHTVSVGGTRIVGLRWARYSPEEPDPDADRPERPGVVKIPDAAAFSDENSALAGVRAAGTRSGAVVRLSGTSDAAPQESRRIFNAM